MTKSRKKTKSKTPVKSAAKAKPKSKLAVITKQKTTSQIVKKSSPMSVALKAVKDHVEPKKKTKIQILIDLLNDPKGTSIEQMMAATGWQRHTVRGALSREVKKKRGLLMSSLKDKGGARMYVIKDAEKQTEH